MTAAPVAPGSGQRLFFAAVPDAVARGRLALAAAALRLPGGSRCVSHSNYHCTLAFIGEVPASSLPVIRDIGATQRGMRFVLRFEAYEYWPKPEVLVAVARSIPQELQAHWQRLHAALAPHQWALSPKRLRPHVTLARKVAQDPVLPTMMPFDWHVTEFSLMRSDTRGAESAYTVVDTWALLDS